MKEDLFKAYLQWANSQMNGKSFHLLLDCYSAHRTMYVQALVVQLGITLHYIPARDTDQFQPRDRLVLAALKSTDRRLFLHRNRDRPREKVTKSETAQMFI